MRSSDSDVGWGEVYETLGCERPDGTLHGAAIEALEGTKLVGRYADGRRVGAWTQTDARTGTRLGGFALDADGSGVEEIRDVLGHVKRGRVERGKRVGTWTFYDRDGSVAATQVWSTGKFVKQEGRVPWDPPMTDPRDACPSEPKDHDGLGDDGCPPPLSHPK